MEKTKAGDSLFPPLPQPHKQHFVGNLRQIAFEPDPVNTSSERRLVYYAAVEPGGLADYAVQQIEALAMQGCHITVVGYPFLQNRIQAAVPGISFVRIKQRTSRENRLLRGLSWIRTCRDNIAKLVQTVVESGARNVLISAYSEYFSPLWAAPLRRLKRKGVWFGTIVHDPVRDFVFGPQWWHQWSISQAYSFTSVAFTHEAASTDMGHPARQVDRVTIPHGPYTFPTPVRPPSKSLLRKQLGIPQDAIVLLSFGHLRDEKNLDLLIRALVRFPQCHLLVAGREQSSGQRPASWYQDLAVSENVSSRCHWINDFIPEPEVHRYFVASDIVALTYSAAFRSASGVLNACSQFRLPVLASSGDGPLKTVVKQYRLGEWVAPDQLNAIYQGLDRLLGRELPQLGWNEYVRMNSWSMNASLIYNRLIEDV